MIETYDDKDIILFSENFIDIALKMGRSVRKAKKHNWVLEIAVSSLKNNFLFIAFTNSHLIIGTN